MSDPTAEEIKAAYAVWVELEDFLYEQSKVVGLWYASDFSVDGDEIRYLDGDNDSQSIKIDEFLDPALHAQRNAERAAERQRAADKANADRAARELARAREIIAYYENRHPNEDIES